MQLTIDQMLKALDNVELAIEYSDGSREWRMIDHYSPESDCLFLRSHYNNDLKTFSKLSQYRIKIDNGKLCLDPICAGRTPFYYIVVGTPNITTQESDEILI